MGFGALGKFVMSLGRELFGSAARGTDGIVELAEKLGVKMDALQDSSPEELASVMDTAVRQRLIDPRDANNVKIELAKDAQEAVPVMPTLKAQDAANKLSKQFGVNFDVSNYPTSYGNSTYVSGRISGPNRTNVRVGFRLSDHGTGDRRKATDDFLTIIDDGNVSAESLVAEVQSQIKRALPKMQKISDDREAKTIAQSDALSRWSELSGNERGEIAVKFNETRPTGFNNVPWKNLTKQQKADFAVDDAQKQYKDSFNIDAAHGQGDSNTSTGTVNVPMGDGKVREMGVEFEPGRTLLADENMGINRFEEVSDKMNETLDPNNLGTWFGGYNSRGEPDVANFFAGRGGDDAAGAVYPVKLRIENPKIFDRYEDFEDEMREWSEMAEEGGTDVTSQAFVKDLQDQGHDGIMIERSDTDTGEVRSDYVPFNANQIRSIFAKFDPSKKDSGNISASIAGGAVGLGALQSVRGDDGNLQR